MRAIWLLFFLIAVLGFAQAQDYRPKSGETVMRLAVVGRGNIFVKLHTKEAPKTCEQIIRLVRSGFYDGQRFHKVFKSPRPFLVQIGDPTSKIGDIQNVGSGGSGTTVPYEDSGFQNDAGAVGLASPKDNPNGGDSQFYLLMERSSFLDRKYSVFGQIVQGMDVLQKIELGDRLQSATILQG